MTNKTTLAPKAMYSPIKPNSLFTYLENEALVACRDADDIEAIFYELWGQIMDSTDPEGGVRGVVAAWERYRPTREALLAFIAVGYALHIRSLAPSAEEAWDLALDMPMPGSFPIPLGAPNAGTLTRQAANKHRKRVA